jgi:hypothetical protein
MVLLGYEFDIIEAMHLRGEGSYPDFNFNRLMDYLLRGLWPFLVQLIVSLAISLPIVGVFMVFYFIFVFSAITARPPTGGPPPIPVAAILILYSCLFAAMFVVAVLQAFVLIPLVLRAGLSQDFAGAFSWKWVRDFIARTWQEILKVTLFLIFSTLVLTILGLLACFVGIYPAAALASFAQAHLWYQLYKKYLERGGTPIPLKVQDAGQLPVDTPET